MAAAGETPRRSFLGGLVVAAGSLPIVGTLIAAARIMLSPARCEGGGEVVVCKLSDVPKDGVLARTVSYRTRSGAFLEDVQRPVFLRLLSDGRVICLSGECTHLGCPVHFAAGAGRFECPCHGGAFSADGTVVAGPPPAPLARFEVLEPGKDGMVRVMVRV
jgi:Rieske Fe-S protein